MNLKLMSLMMGAGMLALSGCTTCNDNAEDAKPVKKQECCDVPKEPVCHMISNLCAKVQQKFGISKFFLIKIEN